MTDMNDFIKTMAIQTYSAAGVIKREDTLAVEDPLEIQLRHPSIGSMPKPISITMRTPGNDSDLAIGFLFTEGIVSSMDVVTAVNQFSANNIMVSLKPEIELQIDSLDRNFYMTSSCGVCGKASIDAIRTSSAFRIIEDKTNVSAKDLYGLQAELLERQSVFSQTGGIHAAALFNQKLAQIEIREDVGRHNALDKLIGSCLKQEMIPLSGHVLLLSGRASFELIQKAGMAGIPIIVAVGAPSSLAVELADELGITLIGFLKENSFNVYSHASRLI